MADQYIQQSFLIRIVLCFNQSLRSITYCPSSIIPYIARYQSLSIVQFLFIVVDYFRNIAWFSIFPALQNKWLNEKKEDCTTAFENSQQLYLSGSIFIKNYQISALRPRQNSRHFPDDIFKWIFLNENVWISVNISLKFVPRGQINNIPTLVQVMAWRRPGDKPLSEPMMVRLPTHICVTRPQWVKIGIGVAGVAVAIVRPSRQWTIL